MKLSKYVRETWCINTFGTHYRADWPNGACPERPCKNRNAYEWWRYMTSFRKLWDSTLPTASVQTLGWKANPDVWVIEFERTESPADMELKTE